MYRFIDFAHSDKYSLNIYALLFADSFGSNKKLKTMKLKQ